MEATNKIKRVKIKSIKVIENADVYDISVAKNQNFFANGLLVHNCAEITLGDGEACNLCELYLNNIESQEELFECARLLYKTQKAIWTLPFHYEKTKAIVKKNMRIGLGVTGVCQSMEKLEWLDKTYKELRKFDKEWSKQRGWPESIKLTTVKPSGCVVPQTKIITDDGLKSFVEIFLENGINLSDKINEHREWYDVKSPFKVIDKDGNYKNVSKLFINGFEETIKMTFDDGFEIECTPNHKFLMSGGEWKSARDISESDKFDETYYKTKGFDTLTIWEYDWNNNKDFYKQRIIDEIDKKRS